jgi:hypothetical protein
VVAKNLVGEQTGSIRRESGIIPTRFKDLSDPIFLAEWIGLRTRSRGVGVGGGGEDDW